nr:hypothetical protein GCM10020092_013260 [Actinoplanes digitatis]
MSRTPLPRPTLLPGLPRIWHTPRTLQLGLDPPRAVLIDLPEPSAAGLLDLLDGSRSERLALARAGSFGMRPDEARTLLDTLHAAGLVVPAQRLFPPAMPERLTGEAGALAFSAGAAYPARTLRRRAAARVVVTGRARLAPGVAVALAAAGVGHVHPDLTGPVDRHETPGGPLTAADIGRPRSEAAAEAIQRAAPGTDTRTVRRGAASLVIRLGGYPHPALSSIGRAQRRRALPRRVDPRGPGAGRPAGAARDVALPGLRRPAPPRAGTHLARRGGTAGIRDRAGRAVRRGDAARRDGLPGRRGAGLPRRRHPGDPWRRGGDQQTGALPPPHLGAAPLVPVPPPTDARPRSVIGLSAHQVTDDHIQGGRTR